MRLRLSLLILTLLCAAGPQPNPGPSDQQRYDQAMSLLRPHLVWHAPALPPIEWLIDSGNQLAQAQDETWRGGVAEWPEAHIGEKEFAGDVPPGDRQAFVQAAAGFPQSIETQARQRGIKMLMEQFDFHPVTAPFAWTLRDPDHPDVRRAAALLETIRQRPLASRAARWAVELDRNNTQITFDVAGGYRSGADATPLMDVRNAKQVKLRLYRIRDSKSLIAAHAGIGEDFIYRDYGLQLPERPKRAIDQAAMAMSRQQLAVVRRARVPFDPPAEDLLAEWSVEVASLTAAPRHLVERDDDRMLKWDDGNRDPDSDYFGDDEWDFQQRLDKEYRPPVDRLSFWRTDRIVKIPGKLLDRPGAYAIVAEANGQRVMAPLLVDPLSLTLGRCRDGVMAVVSDNTGDSPVAGATIVAAGQIGEATSDEAGVAFARVTAVSTRAVIAHKDGRFAVGGFGRVFEGIYRSVADEAEQLWGFAVRAQLMQVRADLPAPQATGHVYEDTCVIAALTDRPTYRPGQSVQFKLIVRRLSPSPATAPTSPPAQRVAASAHAFRDDDFEFASRLIAPASGTPLSYRVVDPKGREIDFGELTLNDFATAAGSVTLSPEQAIGTYSLTVRVGEVTYAVPDVFAVKHYRRPNFELAIEGVPARATELKSLSLRFSGEYLFGKPVSGKVEARLVEAGQWQALVAAETTLNDLGRGELEMQISSPLTPGRYALIASLTDASGRTVTRTSAIELTGPGTLAAATTLPRFVPANAEFTFAAKGKVTFTQLRDKTPRSVFVEASNGVATARLPPGWWSARVDGPALGTRVGGPTPGAADVATVFAYDGDESPFASAPDTPVRGDGWVNLSDYLEQEDGEPAFDEPLRSPLWALFDRHQGQVGQTLPVLVYAPPGARLLFTFEGRSVVDYHIVTLPAGKAWHHVVELPLRSRHLPNVYLQGRILSSTAIAPQLEPPRVEARELQQALAEDDSGENPLWCRIDVTDPGTSVPLEQLKVDIDLPRRDYQPGEQVDVALRVTSPDGTPRAAEVSLAAVDAGVFAFGEDHIDDLAARFADAHPPREYLPKAWRASLGNRSYAARPRRLATIGQALQRAAEAMAQAQEAVSEPAPLAPPVRPAPRPGGQALRPESEIALPALRSDFRETAAWFPQLRTGPDGRAAASFKLPDSLTAFRLTAVALTRGVEFGAGRQSLRVSRPLAIQLFLPRFAVVGDRLQAVAVVHNPSAAARDCRILWTRDGNDFSPESITVAPNESARITAWLNCDSVGNSVISVGVISGPDADSERRELRIGPCGRLREVTFNEPIHDRWIGTLPAGFVPGELRISVSRDSISGALDGLGYLIDYPYGCVEQTMSRFLPAVLVADAAAKHGVKIPPEIAAKIPDVLAKGLTRLYAFQHDDGGWGWWEKDATNASMTVYVVDGLARCRSVGVEVDAGVLQRGCDGVAALMSQPDLDPILQARAVLALSRAGRIDAAELTRQIDAAFDAKAPPAALQTLAMAAATLDRPELSRRLWSSLSEWMPDDSAGLAMRLSMQLDLKAPLRDCFATAERLIGRRQGHRWENTQATAAAIAALARLLEYPLPPESFEELSIRVGGKTVLNAADPAALARPHQQALLAATQLGGLEALPIEIIARSAQPVRLSLTARGVQRLDQTGACGDALRITRRFTHLDGTPITGPVKPGEVIQATLELSAAREFPYVLLEDPRPAGFENADESLLTPSLAASNLEFRDDRLCVFFTGLPPGRHLITHYLRAEAPGTSLALPANAYPMYQEKIRGESAADKLQVQTSP